MGFNNAIHSSHYININSNVETDLQDLSSDIGQFYKKFLCSSFLFFLNVLLSIFGITKRVIDLKNKGREKNERNRQSEEDKGEEE